jgi:plastocyanin
MRLARPSFRSLARLAALAVIAIAVAACAGESSPGWTFAPTPTPTVAPSSEASPPPTAAPSGEASAAPSAAPSQAPGEAVVIKITAQGIAFDTATLEVPANTPFKIEFTNNDAGIPHNVAIHKDSPTGPEVWKGEIFNGVETRTYDVPALPAGTYGFVCTVHPNMTGTLTAK